MKKEIKFLEKYYFQFKKLITKEHFKNTINLKNQLLRIKKNKKKIIIAGNGGSAAISSHFSVDLTKNAKVRSINFNEADLITCFSNDYGYERWIEKAIDYYAEKGDLLILISSSGQSQNMVKAAKFFKKNKIGRLVTFTGHKKNNALKKVGDLKFGRKYTSIYIVECSRFNYWKIRVFCKSLILIK